MSSFPTTQWGVVLAARRGTSPGCRASLEALCRAYWHPIYSYARLGGRDTEDARDLTQEFFTHLLERDLFAVADPERGRFRSFLKGAFDLFAANEWRKSRARKRTACRPGVSIDLEEAESRMRIGDVDSETPETAFERHWAHALIARALDRLGEEMAASGQEKRFRFLRPFLTGQEGGLPYRDIADALETSESAVKVAVHRFRRRFGNVLREEVSQTLSDETRVDEELRHVLTVLGG
jgi:RNA polymerase sigma-70 factor (ECF subfamily)